MNPGSQEDYDVSERLREKGPVTTYKDYSEDTARAVSTVTAKARRGDLIVVRRLSHYIHLKDGAREVVYVYLARASKVSRGGLVREARCVRTDAVMRSQDWTTCYTLPSNFRAKEAIEAWRGRELDYVDSIDEMRRFLHPFRAEAVPGNDDAGFTERRTT